MGTKNRLKLFFTIIFFVAAAYVISMETEKFESKSIIMVKDLSQKQSVDSFGAMLLSQASPTMQDSMLLELYIRSGEMFRFLDQKHHLTDYYSGKQIDILQRLSKNAIFPLYQTTKENLRAQYNKDVSILYDEPSSTLEVGFAHADPKIAQQIVQSIIDHSGDIINLFEKENAIVALRFLKKQENKNKVLFIDSTKKLIAYQNKHHTIDPNIDVQSKSAILANLEGNLVQQEVEYKSKLQYMNKDASEMKLLMGTIENIQKGITKLKTQIAGSDGNTNKLITNVFDFELLKSEVDFNKERYKQTLIKLEELKIQVSQNTKNLIVITKPSLADDYTYHDKPNSLFTILIILSFLYGILTTTLTILKDHKD